MNAISTTDKKTNSNPTAEQSTQLYKCKHSGIQMKNTEKNMNLGKGKTKRRCLYHAKLFKFFKYD